LLTATNGADHSLGCQTVDQLVGEALVIPLMMVVRREFSEGTTQVPFAERDHAIQALLLHGPDEPLRIRVAVRRSRRCPDHANARRVEQLFDRAAPLRIAIADQNSPLTKHTVRLAGHPSQALHDERLVWTRRRANRLHTSGLQFDQSFDALGVRVGSGDECDVRRPRVIARCVLAWWAMWRRSTAASIPAALASAQCSSRRLVIVDHLIEVLKRRRASVPVPVLVPVRVHYGPDESARAPGAEAHADRGWHRYTADDSADLDAIRGSGAAANSAN
jgi:hypothetical protein